MPGARWLLPSGTSLHFSDLLNFGWHFNGADFSAGYAFTAPTGRYTPGAIDNVGSGYWGNNLIAGTTFYITKDKGTSANLFIDWEDHGQKTTVAGTKATPGQAFTMEWGIGQILPLDKQKMDRLLQIGLVGYDQWQVSNNGGTEHLYIDNCSPLTVELFHQLAFSF